MPISQTLIQDIEQKKNKINEDPNYFLKRAKRIEQEHRKLSNIHSYWLENPAIRSAILRKYNLKDSKELKIKAKEGIGKVKQAWEYLVALNEPLLKVISPEIILETGKLIWDKNNYYRVEEVALKNFGYHPPNPMKIPGLIGQLCFNLKNSDYHPIEAAAAAHLEIAGIQPFLDGNKRTARLIQDKILYDSGLPSAFIPSGEREVYIDLLEQALVGFKSGNLKAQRPFFDYIGGKVNTSLDDILKF